MSSNMFLRPAVIIAVAFTVSLHAQERADLIRLVGQTLSGTVISITDGDTVRIRLDSSGRTVRVRLEGIDAPERGEPFSIQARNAVRVLLFEKKAQVKATDVDSYDRLVARVIVNGTDSSVHLLESGLACHFTRFANDPVLATAQGAARSSGKGFWAARVEKPRCVKFVVSPSRPRRP